MAIKIDVEATTTSIGCVFHIAKSFPFFLLVDVLLPATE